MAGYSKDDLLDLISLTLNDLPKQQFEVGWTHQNYHACRIYQEDRLVIDGGEQIERKVMLSNTGNARYRRYFDTDDPAVGDHMHTIRVPWTQLGTNYSWDKLEIMHQMNSTKGFIRLMKERRIDGLWDLADLIEERFWKTPTNATDDLYPYGVPYFIAMVDADDTQTTPAFVGQTIRYQDGTTGTSCANIDASTESKWRNLAWTYTDINAAFMKNIRLSLMYINFSAPKFVEDPSGARKSKNGFYCDFDMAAELMDYADAKDDNHSGKDVLGKMIVDDGTNVLINRVPVTPIPQLNGNTDPETGDDTDPLYYIDFTYFQPVVHDGYWMEESEPMTDRGQHTTFSVFLDGAHQNLCTNRRQVGFVAHKALTS